MPASRRCLHRLVCSLLLASACSRATPAAGPEDAPAPALPSSGIADALVELPIAEHNVAQPVAAPTRREALVPPAPAAPAEDGSWKTQRSAVVRAEPRSDSPALGLLAAGIRIPRTQPAVTDECPWGWVAVQPKGFVCTELQADRRAPTDDVLPRVPDRMRVPGAYGRVHPEGATIYDSLASAQSGLGGRAPGASLTVRRIKTVRAGGRTFWKTRHGLIETKHIRRLRGSGFAGVELQGDDALQLPLAWTVGSWDRQKVDVYRTPTRGARTLAKIPKRKAHRILERSDNGRWIRLEQGWVARADLRIVETVERPQAVEPGERWLDIDLSEQTLVAYEGDTPMFATLISSGRPGHKTPTGVFRIDRKVAERTMNSMADSDDLYSVDKVPWTAYFATGYALHAAFWHSGFGTRRSHGCINLSPADARRLYGWTAPLVAPGWSEIYGHEDQPGSVLQIRSRRDPAPQVRGYAANVAAQNSSAG